VFRADTIATVPLTRRDLGRLLAGSPQPTPSRSAPSPGAHQAPAPARIASGPVEIGLTVPDSFGTTDMSCHDILTRCVSLGIHIVDIDAGCIEALLGAPAEPPLLHPPEVTFETGLLPGEEEMYEEFVEPGRKTFAAAMRTWRRTVSLGPLDALHRRYEVAGVRIATVAWNDLARLADDEIDYAFRVTAALGANAVSTPLSPAGRRRIGAFAEAHRLTLAFTGDRTAGPEDFEAAFAQGAFVGAALDLGEWTVAGHGSPLPFLARHADRVACLYLDDRRRRDGARTWFGEGDAPIRDVLRAMRDHGWPVPAMVRIGYDLPDETAQMAEVARAIDHAHACLTT
jgi:sugar phosphate isomerase/epimerase